MKRTLRWILAAASAAAASASFAGGPLSICGSTPLKYPTATVMLNYDGGGTLGPRTKSAADLIVSNASALWTNVATATITLGRGADLPGDINIGNYSPYLNSSSDGLNPVIYDSDGAIIDALLGSGAKNSVLGFAGSAGVCGTNPRYTEGRAVINGFIGVSETTMTVVLAHELGHLIGLDHTQLDSSQGLSSSNYPLMYPIAYRNTPTLGDDDIAAVSALYPTATVSTVYGTLTGNFRLADGTTPVRGANIWAKENVTGKVYSSVSDYLVQNNGAFQMLLPPGTYTLHAEAIDTQFDSGSSVGPYSDTYPTDPSFQAPMYVGGVAMAPLTLGNAAPTQIAITAGCTATAAWRFNGTGTVTGNCGTVTPPPAPPPSSALAHLSNISTRGQVGTGGNVLIGGFVIGGSTSKTVVITGTGPSLVQYGIANALPDPSIQLVRSSDQVVLATNDNWASAPNAGQIQAAGFAPASPQESAIMVTLPPGAYTAVMSGAGGTTGVGAIAVFEFDFPAVALAKLSTRGQVLTGIDVMIGGFVVTGSGSQNVVIVATGPSLTQYGIANALANPTLTIVRASDQAVVATNDDWQSAANAATIQALGFAPTNPLESAVYLSLPPGAYTAVVSGAGGGTGVGIVAVYTAP
jgi:hypothetical protein